MCGITGILHHRDHQAVSLEELKKSCDSMVHRGPDDEGFFIDGNIGLGMRRLKIIDLIGGHQPISNEDGRFWVVFNGEIYNYQALRAELENKGHKFATHSDTETIVHAYEEFGPACAHKLNGMFAFAIWDRTEQKLVLVRDRLGVKPLYYYTDDRLLAFGSELKAILSFPQVPRHIDLEALDTFLTFEYVPAPLSIFRGIRKLPAGHFLTLQKGKTKVTRYWDLPGTEPIDDQAGIDEELCGLLRDSVRLRLISDVPLGAFLSGGIDSSAIVAFMAEIMDRPVKTFSIGFEDESYNELGYARRVAEHFGTDHHELTIKPDVVGLVQDLVHHLDEPFADVSIFPTFLVSRLARQHVTVVLSGDGGDELFGGYDWYVADKLDGYYHNLPRRIRNSCVPHVMRRIAPTAKKKGAVNKLKRFVEGTLLPASLQHYRWSMYAWGESKDALYAENVKPLMRTFDASARFKAYLYRDDKVDRLRQQQAADIKTYLPDDILVKVDRMSMANSLEARTPFLDYRLVEFAYRLSSCLKLRGLQTKYVLRRCLAGKLPPFVLERKKEGFSIPMKNWLNGELRSLMLDVLSESRIRRRGYFDPAYVRRLIDEHREGTHNHGHLLWALIVFELWHERYLG